MAHTWLLALAASAACGGARAESRREHSARGAASRLVFSRLASPAPPRLSARPPAHDVATAACASTFGDVDACTGADGEGEVRWAGGRVRALRGGADDGQLIQLLDEHGGYTNASLSKYLASHGMRRDARYSVVSVLGPQSSGKSTLLNALFGTRFDVMDAARGRSQTTKGAWVGKAKACDVVVLDMQGTDSREGGEDSKSFERQSALFALAVSDTLVINLWVHDLGRYNAANLHLLRTIIEVHLRLFGAGKRRLVFLCRDHVRQVTPLAALEEMVRADLAAIWAEVPKPALLTSSSLDEHFDIQIASLPHYELERSQWEAEAGALRPLLEWRAAEVPAVPADGFEPFTRSVWGTICAERDLDLPSQREMLARFRCAEVADAAVGAVRNATGPLVRALLAGGEPVANLGARLGALLNASIGKFERVAALYERRVADAKRPEVRARLAEAASSVLERQLEAAVRRAERVHGAALAAAAEKGDLELADRVLSAEAAAASAYAAIAKDAAPAARGGWDFGAVLAAGETTLRQRLARLDAAARREAADATLAQAKEALAQRIEPRALALLKAAPVDMWARIAKGRAAALLNASAELAAELRTLCVPDRALAAALAELGAESRAAVVRAARAEAEHVQDKMRRRFDAAFKLDEAGLPRVWQRTDDVNAACTAAQDGARKLLELMSALPADGKFPEVTLVDEATKVGLLQNLILEARSAYLGATQAQQALTPKARAPLWMLALVGFVLLRELLNLMPSFLMPSFVVQLLSIAAFSFAALIVIAKSVGPRVVLGAMSLVSPGAARTAERLLAMAGVAGAEAAGPQEAVGARRTKVVAATSKARRTRMPAPAAAAAGAEPDDSAAGAGAEFSQSD